jgi:hypothetical protein
MRVCAPSSLEDHLMPSTYHVCMDRYECARDACVQFVGTLRVLRKPLAFRLPALNAELGTIAVQVRA